MFEPELVINSDVNNETNVAMSLKDIREFTEVLISVNPVYDWLEENITTISYKLLKGFITNIVPLDAAGKKYFKKIVHKKTAFTIELWKVYNKLEKMHHEGSLKVKSYLELAYLGYTGIFLFEKYPVDDVLSPVKREANKGSAVI